MAGSVTALAAFFLKLSDSVGGATSLFGSMARSASSCTIAWHGSHRPLALSRSWESAWVSDVRGSCRHYFSPASPAMARRAVRRAQLDRSCGPRRAGETRHRTATSGPLTPTRRRGRSCPSGHAAQSVACYAALAVIAATASTSRARRALASAGAATLALAVGASRVYIESIGQRRRKRMASGAGWLLTLVGARIAWSRSAASGSAQA